MMSSQQDLAHQAVLMPGQRLTVNKKGAALQPWPTEAPEHSSNSLKVELGHESLDRLGRLEAVLQDMTAG